MRHPDDSLTPDSWDDCDGPRLRRPHYICTGDLCGADDCPRCHPENFRDGRYVGDLEEE
jgi:hypothetical protein